jgi:hypothetical protein
MALELDCVLLDRYLETLLERAQRGGATNFDDAHAQLAELVAMAAVGDPCIHDYMRARSVPAGDARLG